MDILTIATSQLDTEEIKGKENNDIIVRYAKESGIQTINDDETPWCSTFVNWCAKKAGLPYSGKANARSWVQVGKKVTDPQPGDIVVFWRESIHSWKGHVGIFFGYNADASKVFCLGGNQSDKVSIAAYGTDKVLSFQRLSSSSVVTVPEPIIKFGDRGTQVIALQTALAQLRYSVGDIDGSFGPATSNALKLFQANNRLTVDGIYGKASATIMTSLLQN